MTYDFGERFSLAEVRHKKGTFLRDPSEAGATTEDNWFEKAWKYREEVLYPDLFGRVSDWFGPSLTHR